MLLKLTTLSLVGLKRLAGGSISVDATVRTCTMCTSKVGRETRLQSSDVCTTSYLVRATGGTAPVAAAAAVRHRRRQGAARRYRRRRRAARQPGRRCREAGAAGQRRRVVEAARL